jgi:secreted Zn-dependent insulinase-like peptidase
MKIKTRIGFPFAGGDWSKGRNATRQLNSFLLGTRGGSNNAYTASEHSNFHFDVHSDHFEEAIRRFVSYFVSPLFRETNVQSELEIVQSEHEKNRCNDKWRTNQVWKIF